jgi:hypothetical protein
MMHLRSVILGLFAGMIAVHPGQCGAAVLTIDFGTENADLPYSEGGLIFTAVSGTGAIRGAPDAMLTTGGTLTPEIRIRASANTPFDLLSLQIERLNRNWRIETSAGGVFAIPGTGVLDFGSMGGFCNITSFDLVNDGGVLNASLYVDDITVQIPSEPRPVLRLFPTAEGMALLWPTTATNFVLEATSSLSAPRTWQRVTNATETVDGMFLVSLDMPFPRQFFRLRKIPE